MAKNCVKLDFAFDNASQSKFPSLKTLGGTIDVLCESHASTLSVNRSWFPVQSGKNCVKLDFASDTASPSKFPSLKG